MAAADLDIADLKLMSQWLGGSQIPLRVGFSTSGVKLAVPEAAADASGEPAIEVADGKVRLHLDVPAMERMLLQVANQLTRQHQATVQSVKLNLSDHGPKALGISAAVTAKKGFFSASLELTGRLVVDHRLHARLADLDLTGKGVMGKMVASLVRGQLDQLESQPIILTSFLPGQVRLEDVHFRVQNELALTLTLGPSRFVLTAPAATGSAAATPAAPTAAPAVASAGAALMRGKRLDIYIIDSGWNRSARQLLDEHLEAFAGYLAQQNVYRLNPEQSMHVLRQSPQLIGSDPILMVLDSDARLERPHLGYGFRFCLGAVTSAEEQGEELDRVLRMVTQGQASDRHILARYQREHTSGDPDASLQILVDMVEPERL